MATPYFQKRFDSVPSTQDVARSQIRDLPLLVIAASQTEGRGRSGSEWLDADRALAVSLAFRHGDDDHRPLSLMAGLAAVRALEGIELKWPNDLMSEERKVGGILVERGGALSVVGMGLNLWWASPPEGMAGVFDDDPGEELHAEIGALWGAELMELIERDGWPTEEYRGVCRTIGQTITWEPGGTGRAVAVADDGGLTVETEAGRETIYSGSVSHVRPVG